MSRGAFLTALIFLVLAGNAARADSPVFQRLNRSAGLPSDTVYALSQDRYGFLWIGGPDGLTTFDGYNFSPFRFPSDDDLAGEARVLAMRADQAGRIWVGTERQGLFLIDDGRVVEHYQHDPKDSDTLSSNLIRAIAIAPDKTVWLGTTQGLDRLVPGSNRITRYASASPVRSVAALRSGEVWVGTYSGLARANHLDGELEAVIPKLGSETIISIHEADNEVWLGTLTGAYLVKPRQGMSVEIEERLSGMPIVSIHQNAYGTWFGSLTDGLFRLVNGQLTNYRHQRDNQSLSDNVIVDIFEDSEGTLWLGTFNNGASGLSTRSLAFGRQDNSSSSMGCAESPVTWAFLLESDVLWVGTEAGLIRFNRKTGGCSIGKSEVKAGSRLPNHVKSITRRSDGALWVGTTAGFAPVTAEPFAIGPTLPGISSTFFAFEVAPMEFMLGTADGLFSYDSAADQLAPVPVAGKALNSVAVTAYAQAPDRQQYFATSAGLATIKKGKLQLLRHEGLSAVPHRVQSVYVNPDSDIWVGVEDRGLWRVAPDGRVTKKLDEQASFPVTMTTSPIVADASAELWVGSRQGLTRISADGEVLRTYEPNDGLQAHWFSSGAGAVSPTGELFFGGKQGFNAFFSHDIKTVENHFEPLLTGFQVGSKSVTADHSPIGIELNSPLQTANSIQLERQHRSFSFKFSLPSYLDPSRNQFAYQLQGQDTDWRETGADQRIATYTNLAPGEYTFRLKAANADGVWSPNERQIEIHILSAWWESWWARLLWVLLVAVGLFAIGQYRTRKIRSRALVLEAQVGARTHELAQQKAAVEALMSRKNALFENVSHEFKTPLTLIIGPLEQLRNELRDSRHGEKLELALRNSKHLLDSVSQILKLSNSSPELAIDKVAREVAPVLHMLVASFSIEAENNEVNLTLESVPDLSVLAAKDTLEIAAGNLISNAIKYVGAGGRVTVSAKKLRESALITVEDNGPGIPSDRIGGIFDRFKRLPDTASRPGHGLGLAVVKEVVEANGGRVFVDSEPRLRTAFGFELQLAPPAHIATLADQSHPASDHSDSSQCSVMVVDDNQDMVRYVGSVLEPEFSFAGEVDPVMGLKLAQKSMPDLIICDLMMPRMDGYEFCRRLRLAPATSHIPVIMLTAKGGSQSRLKAWDETVDAFVEKPFDQDELLSRVRNLISIRKLLSERLAAQFAENGSIDTAQLYTRDQAFVDKLTEILETHYQDCDIDREKIAALMAVSSRQLQRKLQAVLGQNPSELLRDFRLFKGKEILDQGHQVAIASDRCGFSSPSYFAKCFREKFGLSPKRYQAKASRN